MRKIVHTEKAPAAVGPQPGVRAGNLLFIPPLGVNYTGEVPTAMWKTDQAGLTNLQTIAEAGEAAWPKPSRCQSTSLLWRILLR